MVISTEIIQSVMIPLLVAFAISVALSPFVIPFLRRLKVGQTDGYHQCRIVWSRYAGGDSIHRREKVVTGKFRK